MEAATQGHPGYYVWEVPGKPVAVQLHLNVVDRLLGEVMRGFAAVPKRGAEVGGVLIGSIEDGEISVVRIDEFEPVACEYKRGPSYLFTEEDRAAFDIARERWRPDGTRSRYAVGFYRSATRDGMSLEAEDIALMNEHFTLPANVALLIKPFGTKVSQAGFFFRENGRFPDSTPLEFPFRRWELSGKETLSRAERRLRMHPQRAAAESFVPEPENFTPAAEFQPEFEPSSTQSASRRRRSIWFPLSLLFLLLGVALGILIAFTAPLDRVGTIGLGLAISRSGDNLSVSWNRKAPAIRQARNGVLEIEDAGYFNSVELDAALLQSGSMLYHATADSVRFRLVVHPSAQLSIAETKEWAK